MWQNGWHAGNGGWYWLLMTALMIAFWGVIAWVAVSLVRRGSVQGSAEPQTSPPSATVPDPEAILHERLARGEIDVNEYDHRVDAIRAKRKA